MTIHSRMPIRQDRRSRHHGFVFGDPLQVIGCGLSPRRLTQHWPVRIQRFVRARDGPTVRPGYR
jgi:hypothetical protein